MIPRHPRGLLPAILTAGLLLGSPGCSREGRLLRQGDDLFREGEIAEAMEKYARALELAPGSHRAHYSVGVAHYTMDEYPEALAAFTRALELHRDGDYHLQRGNTYSHLKRHDEAIEDYEACLALAPGTKRAYYALGVAYYNKRDYDSAARWLRRYLDRDPPSPERERARELLELLSQRRGVRSHISTFAQRQPGRSSNMLKCQT